jgi:uncharacterized phage-associated protein
MAIQEFPFKSAKVIQAAAVLLDRERSRQMSYYRLLKLLYIADREHLRLTGRPIVGGRAVAMKAGPLHSAAYDLVKGTHPDYAAWADHFFVEGRNIEMRHHPGNGELSKREIQTLLAVAKEFEELDDDDLGTLTHSYPEYTECFKPGTSSTIPLAAIVNAVGYGDDREAILQDAETVRSLDRMFEG